MLYLYCSAALVLADLLLRFYSATVILYLGIYLHVYMFAYNVNFFIDWIESDVECRMFGNLHRCAEKSSTRYRGIRLYRKFTLCGPYLLYR